MTSGICSTWHCVLAIGKTPISLSLISGNTLFLTVTSAIPGVKKVRDALGISDITITTYGSVHKHVDIYDYLILDEAHLKISSYPKMSKSREKLDLILEKNPNIKVIWLSGTPQIESSSKMFHQLNVCSRHSFSKYDDFYHWFNGSDNYQTKSCNRMGYGIKGLTKFTGSSRPSINYDETINFDNKIDPIMIRRGVDQELVNVIPVRIEPPEEIATAIHGIKTKSIAQMNGETFVSDGGASRLSKMHQLAGGSAISVANSGIMLSDFKAKEIHSKHGSNNCCIFYKYVAEKKILEEYFPSEDLFQIESNCTGIDLSHYDEMIIYSLTWSGSTYTQVLNRLVNTERSDIPNIYIYLTNNSPDDMIFRAVSRKNDFNTKFLDRK